MGSRPAWTSPTRSRWGRAAARPACAAAGPTSASSGGASCDRASCEDGAMSDFEQITTDVSDNVLTITLNRPDRLNAWTQTMATELKAAFDQADADDDVRAIIVTGAGRGFCAGADLSQGAKTFDFAARADRP